MARQSREPKEGSFSEYLAWLGVSDPEDRMALAKQIKAANLETHAGVASLASSMIAGLVSGTLPPAVAAEARHWAEMMLTANMAKQALEGGGKSSVELLLETRSELEDTLEASYTTLQPPAKLVIDGEG